MTSELRCPLCSGPVHETEDGYECEVGHAFGVDQMRDRSNLRLSAALWMAIEALDNEATTLRLLGTDDRASGWAEEAEQQAAMLRSFAAAHAPREDD